MSSDSRHLTLNLVLKDLGDLVELDRIGLDDNGYCCLVFDDDIFVHLNAGEHLATLSFDLGPLPPGPEFMRLALRNNFCVGENRGAYVGVHPEDDLVVLFRQVAMQDLTLGRFEETLRDFLATIERWRRALVAAETEAGTPAEPGPAAEQRRQLAEIMPGFGDFV